MDVNLDSFLDELRKIAASKSTMTVPQTRSGRRSMRVDTMLRKEKDGSLYKQAGVGWDLHGYKGDPKDNPKDYKDDDEAAFEAHDRQWDLRIKTPQDQAAGLNYRMNEHIDYGAKNPGALNKFKTDFAYSEPKDAREVRLGKPELKKFLQAYKGQLDNQDPKRQSIRFGPITPEEKQMAQAIIQKGEHLLKQKDFQFARVEYE